jgi:hypothetical protein
MPSPTCARISDRDKEKLTMSDDVPHRRTQRVYVERIDINGNTVTRRTRSSAAKSACPRAMPSTASRSSVRRIASSAGLLPGQVRDRAEAGDGARPRRARSQRRREADRRAALSAGYSSLEKFIIRPRSASATSAARARKCAPASTIRAIRSRSSSASPSPICSTRTSRSAAISSGAIIIRSTISANIRRHDLHWSLALRYGLSQVSTGFQNGALRAGIAMPLTEWHRSARAA